MGDLIAKLIPVIGLLAFAVSVIVEVIKGVSFLKKIPTDLVVIVLALALTIVVFFGYAAYTSLVITWYMVVGAVIMGFFVAFITMYGWEKFNTLYKRFKQ